MTVRTKEWVLEKVKKLLALGENAGATEGERDNAMRMAHRLIAKHNLEMAEVRAAGGKVAEDRGVLSAVYFGRPWARMISHAIADLFFCNYVYVAAEKGKDTKHFFIGLESNATTAVELSKFLVESVMKEGKRKQRGIDAGNAYFRSFATGAAATIRRRVDEMIRTSSKEDVIEDNQKQPGTALVLASLYQTEKQANQAVIEQTWKKVRTGRGGKQDFDYLGSRDGVEYGSKVSLSRQLGGKSVAQVEEK